MKIEIYHFFDYIIRLSAHTFNNTFIIIYKILLGLQLIYYLEYC
jgi:hypothetical protein